MAFASSSFAQPVVTFATFLPVSEKLTRSNYILWKAQVLLVLKGGTTCQLHRANGETP
jgi:hypothetical protein